MNDNLAAAKKAYGYLLDFDRPCDSVADEAARFAVQTKTLFAIAETLQVIADRLPREDAGR